MWFYNISQKPWCLKITEKVSFNFASEARYAYILSRQKLISKYQIWCFLASFWKPESCGQTVLPDSHFYKTKINGKGQKAKNSNATFWGTFKHCENVSWLCLDEVIKWIRNDWLVFFACVFDANPISNWESVDKKSEAAASEAKLKVHLLLASFLFWFLRVSWD